MKPRFAQVTKDRIRDLAVSYSNYVKAVTNPDHPDRDCAISVWGGILLEKQEQLGIILCDPVDTTDLIGFANERWSRQQQEKVA